MAKTNGGVQLLHLNGTEFDITQEQSGVVIEGIYEKIEGTTKRFVVSGFSIKDNPDSTGKEYKDVELTFDVQGTDFVGEAWAGDGDCVVIRVDDDDKVYVYKQHYNGGETLPGRPEDPETDTTYVLKLSYDADAEGDPWTLAWVAEVAED